MSEWPQIKARLAVVARNLGAAYPIGVSTNELAADIRAALQRESEHEERLRQICCGCGESALTHRIDYGQPSVVRQESDDGACGLDQCGEWLWVGADKELVALRQQVEELERELADTKKHLNYYMGRTAQAEAKLAKVVEALEWMRNLASGVGRAGAAPEVGEFEAACDDSDAALAAAKGE